ncbi:hypothetical protein CDEST_11508 [Colletotrichum destructivum]|uniref:Uncharacterized protein n=1 Tax=Colletotrichum destructivum TaxID=34406 RepID=A0AAX4ITF2_9PEZI|nr:hypothetical protein CDEST_11508 [Colletotrichum destructivum]
MTWYNEMGSRRRAPNFSPSRHAHSLPDQRYYEILENYTSQAHRPTRPTDEPGSTPSGLDWKSLRLDPPLFINNNNNNNNNNASRKQPQSIHRQSPIMYSRIDWRYWRAWGRRRMPPLCALLDWIRQRFHNEAGESSLNMPRVTAGAVGVMAGLDSRRGHGEVVGGTISNWATICARSYE